MICPLRSLGVTIFGKEGTNGTVNSTTENKRANISGNTTMRSGSNVPTLSDDDYVTNVAIPLLLITITIILAVVYLLKFSSSHPPLTVESKFIDNWNC